MDPNTPPPMQQKNPLANYQFSSDELRVLRECNRISFYQRSLPFAGILGSLTYYGVKSGYLTGNPKFGAAPKVAVAIAIGYFVGKVSFQNQCAQMIMKLPNSKLGEILRQKQKGAFYGQLSPDQGFGSGMSLQPFSSFTDSYSDEEAKRSQSSVLDLDESRPVMKGLDDVYRPNLDSPPIANYDDLQPIEPKPGVSYEELRKRNREEFYKKQNQPLPAQPPANAPLYKPPPVVRERQPSVLDDSGFDQTATTEPRRKNKYGDVWT
uniref:CSON000263 protein n=1 Tax=Culicoides sonorensis TaxID=179676 RepID=A0A336MIB8_CULSO